MNRPVLYLFGSAAPPVQQFAEVARSARTAGYDVCVGLTPTAARWLDGERPLLEELTGYPVRSEYKQPTDPDVWPPANVIVFAPVTFNSLNAWALGLTHHFVVGVVAEGIGKGIPTVAMPCVNTAYTQHPQFDRSVTALRGAACFGAVRSRWLRTERAGQGTPRGIPMATGHG